MTAHGGSTVPQRRADAVAAIRERNAESGERWSVAHPAATTDSDQGRTALGGCQPRLQVDDRASAMLLGADM